MQNKLIIALLLASVLLVSGCLNVVGEDAQSITLLNSESKSCYPVSPSESTVSGCLVKNGEGMKKCPRNTAIQRNSECLLCNRDIEGMHYWSSVDCNIVQN